MCYVYMCVPVQRNCGRPICAYNIKLYAGEYFFPLSPCDEGSFEHTHGHIRIYMLYNTYVQCVCVCLYAPRSYVGSGDRIQVETSALLYGIAPAHTHIPRTYIIHVWLCGCAFVWVYVCVYIMSSAYTAYICV